MRKTFQKYMLLLLTVSLVGTGITLADTNVTILGDVNGDGTVNTADVTALVNYLHGSGTVNETAADVNRDGVVDIADVTAINNIISSRTFDKGTASTLFFPATTVGKTYGDAAFTNPIVRSGSTGDITYESSATGVATVNTTTGVVTITGAGTATITATLAGNGGISGATADYTLNVAQKALTITAKDQSIAYGNSIATGTEQVTANGLVDGDALTAVTLTASTDQVTTSGTITPSAAATTKGIENYNVTYTAGNLTVNKVAASVTTAPTGKTSLTYTGEAQELVDATSATCTGGTLVYSKTEDGTYGAASTITETYAGTYSFWYKVQGDGNHDDSTPVEISGVVIAKANPTYTAPALTALTYTGSPQNLVSAGSSSHGTFTYSTAQEGTYSETIPQGTAAGNYTVWYKLTGDANHNDVAATEVTGVSIAQKEVTVSGITAENKTYDGTTTAALVCTGATITGKVDSDELTVTATGTFADANVGTGKTVTISEITLNGAGVANYKLAASGNQETTTADITAASFTPVVTLSGWTYGSPNIPSVGETNTSGGTVTYYYKTGDAEWTETQPTDVGTHHVKASIAANGNYAAAESAPVEFTITQASNSFTTQPTISGWTYGESANAPTSAVVQFGTPTYKYSTAADGTYGTYDDVVNGQAGTWYVKGFVEATTNYAAAESNPISFTIAQAAGSISYATTSVSKSTSDAEFTNPLTKTGDGTVTYVSSTTSVATVNSTGVVSIAGAGTTTITATVADGANYTYATNTASYTLTVTAAYTGISSATASDIGKLICADGHIHAYDEDAACTKDRVAIIAYVGDAGSVETDNSTYKGLAIAMSDANSGSSSTCAWKSSNDDTCVSQSSTVSTALGYKDGIASTNTLTSSGHSSHGHAAATAAKSNNGTASPTSCSGWFLPSLGQWQLIVQGLTGKSTPLSTTSNSEYWASAVNAKITAAGGTGVQAYDYWSSTESNTYRAWNMNFYDGYVSRYTKADTGYVRSALAF